MTSIAFHILIVIIISRIDKLHFSRCADYTAERRKIKLTFFGI